MADCLAKVLLSQSHSECETITAIQLVAIYHVKVMLKLVFQLQINAMHHFFLAIYWFLFMLMVDTVECVPHRLT